MVTEAYAATQKVQHFVCSTAANVSFLSTSAVHAADIDWIITQLIDWQARPQRITSTALPAGSYCLSMCCVFLYQAFSLF